MSVLIALAALALLMLAAYRGYSVILFAPIAALGAVLLTDPSAVGPTFTGLFMEKMVGFVKLYFPVFLLGAVFGKLIELSGFSRSIVAAAIRLLGRRHAIPVIVLVCALLTYGGVSLFVVAFAVYPFAAELFRQSGIPKRLIPATVALGAFSFTMDALPGTPQIQNIIPTSFFGTNAWAAPWLGLIGSLFIITFGLLWLDRQRRRAQARGEGYGTDLQNEPETPDNINLPHPLIAIAPLLLVGVLNLLFTRWIPQWYGPTHELSLPGLAKPIITETGKITAIWAVEAALLSGILVVLLFGFRQHSRPPRRRQPDGGERGHSCGHEHRLGIWLRRGHCRPAGVSGAVKSADRDPQPAAERSDQRHGAGRDHRFGLRGDEHRAGGDVGYLYRRRARRQHSA
ncbi:H+/gluconate symporter and related permeases [Raoultella terrigena]|uniref:H+/gluconate symporter and related permeases n=1 Tax=Raoultella terrigena TaxID=577 RepID=A0A4U9CW67_RAOTE|nr:H+/gluconate symporter and related permeases [Raoultella terrigena]